MTWTKLSDDFTDDTWTLSDAAYRLHCDGLIWSNRKLLDLCIPKDDLRRFKTAEAIGELVAEGWWKDEGAYYLIVHHARYQRTREAVIKQQKVNKENRAKGGRATPPPRELGKPSTPTFPPPNNSSDRSLHDSSNEMDRTGQAYIEATEKSESSIASSSDSYWPLKEIPGSEPDLSHEVAVDHLTREVEELPAPGTLRCGCGRQIFKPEGLRSGRCDRCRLDAEVRDAS